MKILAIVPARGGSKRLPGKNLRPLGGKPLVAWSIDAARAVPAIADVLVSTDDEAIADIARRHGALVPWLRPAELSTDEAATADVCLHALDWYESQKGGVDGVLVLQPTSPFRGRDTIVAGLDLYRARDFRRVVSFSPAAFHPMWCVRIDGDRISPFVEGGGFHLRSQDLPPAYAPNGALYLVSPSALRATRSLYGDDVVPLVMNEPHRAVDIDTEMDWRVAESVLAAGMAGD